VSAGYWHTVGLRSDGTVVATGENLNGQCSVGDWQLKPVTPKPVTLSFDAPTICDYASAKVSGYLKDAGDNPLGGRSIQIQYLSGKTWIDAGSPVTTDGQGRFERTVAPKTFASYRAHFAGGQDYAENMSAVDTVLPRVRLTRKSDLLSPKRSKTYSAWGYIEPRHYADSTKLKVKAYKKGSDGEYHYVKSFTATFSYYSKSKTKYAAKLSFGKGKWRIRAYHPTDPKNYKTYGSWDYFTVK
jgi:hypothetical protein